YGRELRLLTDAGVRPDQTGAVPTLVEAPVRRVDLARGSATGPPDEIQVAQVVEHALRHLSWLMRDDPVLATILTGPWVDVLEGYEPEPFRALNREDVAEE